MQRGSRMWMAQSDLKASPPISLVPPAIPMSGGWVGADVWVGACGWMQVWVVGCGWVRVGGWVGVGKVVGGLRWWKRVGEGGVG